jgi:hypothetical protein
VSIRSRIFTVSVLSLSVMFVVVPAANAYIDPGSGSFIFQAMVGGLLAAALVFKGFWRRIVSFFTKRRTADER